ncbi:hypothetical protein MNEG_8502 [Monoraphidium neglectum]|uniref:Protein kinase domain-containing protein n=1 Tax=Monoraphidium neglectum TaxID=145388 RepID=A0A0D2KVP4_9CHLO|nr:hypothetical protein MNEG_8502 [Monoraphidium neglectum]KIY99458.1 hypothetical protein MNEG_8502 [Monoraphidium neglectum]|eukprot:XP_013898478.1 hypothetical protein MNEG_8502 [Monoraphidium neglectum]
MLLLDNGTPRISWELSPSGAANPSGSLGVTLLDIFSDVRASRGHDADAGPSSGGRVAAAPVPAPTGRAGGAQQHAAEGSADAGPAASPFSAPAAQAGSDAAPAPAHVPPPASPAAPQPVIELSEAKTRGGSTAFAALTAIDCIAEETEEGSSHGGGRSGSSRYGRGPGPATGAAAPLPRHDARGAAGSPLETVASEDVKGDASLSQRRVRYPQSDRREGPIASRDRGLLYAAPEVLRGDRITEKADVFSFGVVLYELLSRSLLLAWRLTPPPPPAANGGGSSHAADRSASRSGRWAAAAAAQLQHRGGGAEAAAMLAYARRVSDGYRAPRPPFWPPQIRGLVDACCAQEPHERPRMEEVLEALREICGDERVISDLNSYIHKDVGFVPLSLHHPY